MPVVYQLSYFPSQSFALKTPPQKKLSNEIGEADQERTPLDTAEYKGFAFW